jgi:hypothetical protein
MDRPGEAPLAAILALAGASLYMTNKCDYEIDL